MNSLVASLKAMGWAKILGFRQDWNEAIIRQFYATLELRADKEQPLCMTGTSKFKGSFKDLAVTV